MERFGESYREPVESPEEKRIRKKDEIIRRIVLRPRASRLLQRIAPVAWLKGAIGVDTNRGASQISDKELTVRYHEGGRLEWDPFVAQSVALYLRGRGSL